MVSRCGHQFCEVCIRTALKVKRECPICRIHIASHRELRTDNALTTIVGSSAPPRALDAEIAAAGAGDTWKCDTCTLGNVLAASRCMACSARRPANAVRLPSAAAIEATTPAVKRGSPRPTTRSGGARRGTARHGKAEHRNKAPRRAEVDAEGTEMAVAGTAAGEAGAVDEAAAAGLLGSPAHHWKDHIHEPDTTRWPENMDSANW